MSLNLHCKLLNQQTFFQAYVMTGSNPTVCYVHLEKPKSQCNPLFVCPAANTSTW